MGKRFGLVICGCPAGETVVGLMELALILLVVGICLGVEAVDWVPVSICSACLA